jgi:hypothetical protein
MMNRAQKCFRHNLMRPLTALKLDSPDLDKPAIHTSRQTGTRVPQRQRKPVPTF